MTLVELYRTTFAQHPRPDAPDHQGRSAGLRRGGQQFAVARLEERAVEVDLPVGEEGPDDRERLLEAGDAMVEREAECPELRVVPARPEAHDVPRKLKTLATKSARSWLHATLTVKSSKLTTDALGEVIRPGLPASGMFIINPPFTLKPALQSALPQMVAKLAQDPHATFTLDSGG